MGDKSAIEWTNATWNPVVGCDKVSAGCTNCYAIRTAARLAAIGQEPYQGMTIKRGDGSVNWTGVVRTLPERLEQPLNWKQPRRIFVNSMSDLFHEDVEPGFIADVFATMAMAKQHAFQVLTKRAQRMHDLLGDSEFLPAVEFLVQKLAERHGWPCADEIDTWPLPNVWLGVSVEDQPAADERIPLLLQTPAAVRFLSCEPLLGPVGLRDLLVIDPYTEGQVCIDTLGGEWVPETPAPITATIDWVIAGGESGAKARPMHPDWVRSLRDQCQAAGVAFFFKQWGEFGPVAEPRLLTIAGDDVIGMARVGKHRAGRELDGRTWDEFPRG